MRSVAFCLVIVLGVTLVSNRLLQADSASVLIKDVPHVRQKPDFCGEACVAAWLQKLGSKADQDAVFDQSGLDPTLGRGCYTKELDQAIRRFGFKTGPVWNRIKVADHERELERHWSNMVTDLRRGVPSIICTRTRVQNGTEHFRLILGYDAKTDEVIYHEPADDDGAYHRMAKKKFMTLWPLQYDPQEWLVVRFALATETVPRLGSSTMPTSADYAQHIMQLKDRLPNKNFTVVLQHPFVVVGDEPESKVRSRAEHTVKWATDKLKKQYFAKDPDQILDIWLFKDQSSYESNALRLFNSKPSTPYGYYSPSDKALVMNIATGGGTLVHEIVHPFVEANFPECPSWFNEGLGSLYEQSNERDKKIIGMTNWRLAGLQRAIKAGNVPSFATLCSTTRKQFYNEDPGTHYAQARYLCYYLQEHDLLGKYYHSFVVNHKTDPTGYKTLQQVLGTKDIPAFQKKWEAYVMTLRFR